MIMDVRTLFIAVTVACITECLTITVVWATNRRIPGLVHWTIGTALAAVSMPLFLFQGQLDSRLLTYALPNLVYQAAMISLCIGAHRFVGRAAPMKWLVGGTGLLLGLLAWFTFADENLESRVRLASAWSGAVFLITAGVLWRSGVKGMRASTRATALGFSLAAGIMIYRTAFWSGDASTGWISGYAWQNSMLALLALTMSYIWIFLVLYMVSQFRTREVEMRMREKHATEQQLFEAKHDLEQERMLRLRQTVARDLHDGIGGITAAVATLAGLGRSEAEKGRAEIFAMIEEMATMGSKEIRELMGSVERGLLGWNDWLRDVENYARRITAAVGIELHWEIHGDVPDCEPQSQQAVTSLMKVIFEGLHNMVKHSEAGNACVTFQFVGQYLEVTIRDDGRGFEGIAKKGRGVVNMRARIMELGGLFSHDGVQGTRVWIKVPLPLASTDPTESPSDASQIPNVVTHETTDRGHDTISRLPSLDRIGGIAPRRQSTRR
jgi:signal transduction histidine kinase